MIRETGVDGVTVARGAIGNPWIFQQARALAAGSPLPPPPTLFEQRDLIREHYRLAAELYGPVKCGPPMRKFGIKYAQLHPRAQEVREAFVRIRTADQIGSVLDEWYAEDLPGRYSPPPDQVGSLAVSCER
jgi:tRNA-dihydrouridine synthase